VFIDWFWFILLWPETEECVALTVTATQLEKTPNTPLTPKDKEELLFRCQFLWLLWWHFRFELELL